MISKKLHDLNKNKKTQSQDKKVNLLHAKDVYYSISSKYTRCKLDLTFIYMGEMEKYTFLYHCVTCGKWKLFALWVTVENIKFYNYN